MIKTRRFTLVIAQVLAVVVALLGFGLQAGPASAATAVEQSAASWAQSQTGSTSYQYQCLKFVYQAYISAGMSRAAIDANAGYVANANTYPIDEWNYWMSGHLPAGQIHQGHDAAPPIGAIIYYSSSYPTGGTAQQHHDNSHATISLGGGQQISPDTTSVSGPQSVNTNSYRTMLGWWLPEGSSGGGGGGSGGGGSASNLASNGGFEQGSWSTYPGSSTNVTTYRNGQVSGISAHSGLNFEATNTSSGGGGIYEDIPVSASSGGLYCVSAWVAGGGSGQLVAWLLGGSYNENGVAAYSGLNSTWRQISTCVAATTAHNTLRIQVYPTVNNGTTYIDDVDAHQSLASNGGFEQGSWSTYPGSSTNVTTYRNGQVSGISAHSGLNFEATNTSSGGGGIYEDIPVSASSGGLYCVSAWVAGGGSGQLVAWLLGGSYNENGVAAYSGLNSTWRQISTCVAATTAHNTLRIQVYPTVNNGTTYIDDVDAHQSLASNGGFEQGSWSTYPGSSTNVTTYRNGQVSGISAHSGLNFEATNTSSGGGGIYEDIPVSASSGGLYCVSAWVAGGGSGQLVAWLLGGSYNENGVAAYSGLNSTWRQISTCVAATTAHNTLRIQVYPTVNNGTTYIDDVDAV